MSLWISSIREPDHGFSTPQRGAARQPDAGRSLYAYVLAGLIGLSAGLIIGQLAAEHRGTPSRIQWPAPVLPHPRTLPP
jgi:hypothetical protein